MKRYRVVTLSLTLLLSIAFSAPAAAQIPPDLPPLEDIQDELRDLLDAVNFTSITAGLINLGTTRDTRASSLKINRDPEDDNIFTSDKRKVNISRLYVNLFRPYGERGRQFRLGVYISSSKTEEPFELQRLLNYAGDIRTKSNNIGFDLGYRIPFGRNSKWSFEPGLGFGYSRFKSRHDYVGDLGEQIIKPIAEGIFFNWNSNVFSYRGMATFHYELPFGDRMIFRYQGTYVHSYIDSIKVTDPVQRTNSHFDSIFNRVRLTGPTDWSLFGRDLGWRVTVSNTTFVGKNDDVLGFRWFNRYDADIVWNYTGDIRVLNEITFGFGVTHGADVEGFSFGFGIRLKI